MISYHCRADCCGVCSDPKCTCPHHARTLSRTTKKLYAEHEKRYFLDDVNRQAWLKEQLAKVEGKKCVTCGAIMRDSKYRELRDKCSKCEPAASARIARGTY